MKVWVKVLIGLFLGVGFGLIAQQEIAPIAMVGKIFINLLKMLVGLVIFASIVTGVCQINDPKKLGRIGVRTLFFFVWSTVIAIGVGLGAAYLIHPGQGLSLSVPATTNLQGSNLELIDFCISLVPSNPFLAFAQGNVLQIITFSLLFAYGIMLAGERGKKIYEIIESLAAALHNLTYTVMKFAPYGVFALMASSVGAMGIKVIVPLLKFLLCNYIACLFQILVVFSLILRLFLKLSPVPFFKGMKEAIALAFSTSSSSATLPVALKCAREQLGVAEDISGFVLSLGSTVNMNGAAIGLATASIFTAEIYGIQLSFLQIGVITFTSLIAAIGAAGIPGAGIVMLSVVLSAVGLPLEGIALLAGVDRIRDMISTVTNILGDGVAAVYVAKKEKHLDEEIYNYGYSNGESLSAEIGGEHHECHSSAVAQETGRVR
ncbi:MAG: dicarboxylate/amino acid:cation symporter [Chlamydiae bacterium]|nr:dicarboxylate/amino acid:cation symporter [Chlamydiota bacterium]